MAVGEPAVDLPSRVYTLDLPPLPCHTSMSRSKAPKLGGTEQQRYLEKELSEHLLTNFREAGGWVNKSRRGVSCCFLFGLQFNEWLNWWFGGNWGSLGKIGGTFFGTLGKFGQNCFN